MVYKQDRAAHMAFNSIVDFFAVHKMPIGTTDVSMNNCLQTSAFCFSRKLIVRSIR